MNLPDLPPQKDPKGGSPKTPLPTSLSKMLKDLQQSEPTDYIVTTNTNGIWRAIATGLGGLLLGMTVAWFTAFQSRGVSQKEMEEYVRQNQVDQERHILTRSEMQEFVRDASPWAFDKQAIVNRLAGHDQQIGELRTKIDLAAGVIENQNRQQPKP